MSAMDVFRVTLRRNAGNMDLGGVTVGAQVRETPDAVPVKPTHTPSFEN